MLFNTIFDYSVFPSSWRLEIITSTFKKGRRNNPSNYRGISLLSNLSKILTGILNTRIIRWVEEKIILSESQAGFRKGRSTVDHIFVLKTKLDKFLTRKKGRFYCLLVDFLKAFDCVNRDYLIYTLIKNRMHGKMLKLLRDMHSNVMASVKTKRSRALRNHLNTNLGSDKGAYLAQSFSFFS